MPELVGVDPAVGKTKERNAATVLVQPQNPVGVWVGFPSPDLCSLHNAGECRHRRMIVEIASVQVAPGGIEDLFHLSQHQRGGQGIATQVEEMVFDSYLFHT